jgi:hypothetical protein
VIVIAIVVASRSDEWRRQWCRSGECSVFSSNPESKKLASVEALFDSEVTAGAARR